MAAAVGRRSDGGEAQDHTGELGAASLRDPLCHLATNKDSKGVEGKWRLIGATTLCTLFMVQHFCSNEKLLSLLFEHCQVFNLGTRK